MKSQVAAADLHERLDGFSKSTIFSNRSEGLEVHHEVQPKMEIAAMTSLKTQFQDLAF